MAVSSFRLEIDDRKMRRFIREMPKGARRAIVLAQNKTIRQARTLAAREVAHQRNLKIGDAKRDMRLDFASSSNLEAAIVAHGEPIPVMKVKGTKTQTKRGVTVKIGPGPRHLYEGAFIAKTKSGHVGVFKRASHLTDVSKGASPGTKRFNLPIFEKTLPSVASTMVGEHVLPKLRRFSDAKYEAELVRLLNREMTKAGAK
jgi:hypothetical protein